MLRCILSCHVAKKDKVNQRKLHLVFLYVFKLASWNGHYVLCSYYRIDAYIRSQALYPLSTTHILQKKTRKSKKMKLATQIFFCGFFIVLILHTQPATSQEVGKAATLHMHWNPCFVLNKRNMHVCKRHKWHGE